MNSAITEKGYSSVQSTSYQSEICPFNSTLTHTYNQPFGEENNFTAANVSEVLDSISSYMPDDTTPFTSVTIDEYYLEVTILNITVYNDHDTGAGEIYLEVWSNNLYSKLDNGGSYYELDDSATNFAVINTQVFSGWTNKTQIYIDVKESDLGSDEELGLIDIDGVYNFNWTQIFTTSLGEADVAISANITGHRSVTLDDNDVAYLYQPYVFLDVNDFADAPTMLFYRVLEGFDTEFGTDAICIQYLYYWPFEMDNFGADLGHYYDFSPLYLYITDVGHAPYRLVFQANNPGVTALPAQLEIYSSTVTSSGNYLEEVNVSDELRPILGQNAIFTVDEYPIDDFYNDPDFYTYPSTELPDIVCPLIMVTDSYHNLEFGDSAIGTTDFGYNPSLTNFTDIWIETFYELLEESFNSPLHDYSWNNYEVPENLSLTLDIKQNPFIYPFQTDCFENVTHQNSFAREQEASDLTGIIDFTTTLVLPGILNITYPESVEPGDDVELLISVDMLGDEANLIIDYIFDLNVSLGVWFIHTNSSIDLDGRIDVKIPLDTISTWQRKTGFNAWEDVANFRDYLTIDYLFLEAALLGPIANASVSVHLLDIVSDIISTVYPASAPLFEILEWFVEGIDLVLEPELRGIMVGELTTTNPSIASLNTDTIRFDEDNDLVSVMMSIDNGATSTDDFSIEVSDLSYGLNFTNAWSLVVDFSDLVNLFIEDWEWDIGIYPNLEWTSTTKTGEIQSNATLVQSGNIDVSPTVSSSESSSESETASTTSEASASSSGFTIIVVLITSVVILGFKRKWK